MSGVKQEEILQSLNLALKRNLSECDLKLSDYHEKNVSYKIVNIIQSYIPYINKKIWSKS